MSISFFPQICGDVNFRSLDYNISFFVLSKYKVCVTFCVLKSLFTQRTGQCLDAIVGLSNAKALRSSMVEPNDKKH